VGNVGETSFDTPGDLALEITRKFDAPDGVRRGHGAEYLRTIG
jgi:hypothetical protein